MDGISFGNFLIKRVVDHLSHEFPNLKTFATLSPIPRFNHWLQRTLSEGEAGLLLPAERKALVKAYNGQRGAKGALKELVTNPDWVADEATAKALKPVLMRLGARYLAREKRRDTTALDPVAHFHLSNGARIERLNWMADVSRRGLEQSSGMMINYRYDLSELTAITKVTARREKSPYRRSTVKDACHGRSIPAFSISTPLRESKLFHRVTDFPLSVYGRLRECGAAQVGNAIDISSRMAVRVARFRRRPRLYWRAWWNW